MRLPDLSRRLAARTLATGLAAAMLAIVAASGAPAFAADPGVTGTDIKIGVHLPLTGPASFVGQGSKVGIDTAVAEINAHGGVAGRKLSIVYADDRGAPDGGVNAVRRLVDDEQVFAVFGAGASSATVAVVPFFRQNDSIPYYVSLASDPRVLEKFSRNIFLGATIPQVSMVQEFARLPLAMKYKNIALMLCDQAHCTSGGPLLKAALEAGGARVTTYSYNSGDTDFTGQVQQIRALGPDAVFVYGLAADGGRIFPQLRRAGVGVPLLSDTSLADLAVPRMAGAAAEGYYTFWLGGTQFIEDKTGAMGKLLASMDANRIERPTNTPNLYTLMTYSDIYVLAEGLRQAGQEPTRLGLITALQTGIHDFVAGKDANFTYAAAIAAPRSFSTTDHQGTRTLQAVVYRNGGFQPVSE